MTRSGGDRPGRGADAGPATDPTGRREFMSVGGLGLAGLSLRAAAGDRMDGPGPVAIPDLAPFGDRDDEPFWAAVRGNFALDPGIVYLNNGSLGPVPLPVLGDLASYSRELAANPSERMWGPLGSRLEEVRARLAALVGAGADDVALTRNTTEGIGTVGLGLELKPGDEVVQTDQEHPGGAGVWQFLETRGVRRINVPLPLPPEPMAAFLERLEGAMTPKTRALALPHVSFGTGHVLPLAEIASLARARSVPLCVDGAHPPGMLPVDLGRLDCATYASSSHKWLLSPPGTGFLMVGAATRERIAPRIFTGTGFAGRTARRYDDFGTRNLAEVLAQGSAVEFHRRVGSPRAFGRIRALTSRLREGLEKIPRVRLLTPAGPGGSGGLTSFIVPGIRHDDLLRRLGERGHFVLRAVPELDAIRVSTGIYNTFGEIDLLLGALGGAVTGKD